MILRQNVKLTREVPWNDLTDDTDRLVTRIREFGFRCLTEFNQNAHLREFSLQTHLLYLTGDLVSPTSIVAKTVDGASHIGISGPVKCFAYKMYCG